MLIYLFALILGFLLGKVNYILKATIICCINIGIILCHLYSSLHDPDTKDLETTLAILLVTSLYFFGVYLRKLSR